jgi:hypothetical protein
VRSHRSIANAFSLRWVGRRKRESRHGRHGIGFLHFDLQITSKIEKPLPHLVDRLGNRVRGLLSVLRSSPGAGLGAVTVKSFARKVAFEVPIS